MFWSLSVPIQSCLSDPSGLLDKLGFCLEQIQEWDTRTLVKPVCSSWKLSPQRHTNCYVNARHDILRAIDDDDIRVFKYCSSKQPTKDWRAQVQSPEDPRRGNNHVRLIGDAIHPMLLSR
jgi:hypothetical protein